MAEQFGVKNFNSLSHGDLLSFLENNTDQLPRELLKLLGSGMCENSSIKACMSSNELVALLSQAISRFWENEIVIKQIISMLLMRQFHSIGFEFVENGSLEDLLDTVREHKSNVTSKYVVLSSTMIEEHYHIDSLSDRDNNWSGITTDSSEMDHKTKSSETITAKNAIGVLLKSPMPTTAGYQALPISGSCNLLQRTSCLNCPIQLTIPNSINPSLIPHYMLSITVTVRASTSEASTIDDESGEPEPRFKFRAYIGEVWYMDLVVQALPPPTKDYDAEEKI
ncbi:hypothetical protein KIW84_074979 [Lathyrus oleraceus]|uniref:Uncharacterized protein n=1 Tax=Pisum sativum TaxID=3888 RepID=A0A9D4VSL2_PEA|nr:hypothetical protein KIW84_074979 [Pisum sativum]